MLKINFLNPRFIEINGVFQYKGKRIDVSERGIFTNKSEGLYFGNCAGGKIENAFRF